MNHFAQHPVLPEEVIRQQIHQAMQGAQPYSESGGGDWYLSQSLGLRGLLFCRMTEVSGGFSFGIRIIYASYAAHVIQAQVNYATGQLWVMSEVRKELNGSIRMESIQEPLFISALAYVRQWQHSCTRSL